MTEYYYQRQTAASFEVVERALREALKQQGFGIITEIDVQKTVKEKLGIDQEQYKILGACNPKYAHQALSMEPDIGVLLPCNVVIRAHHGMTVISSVLPTVQLQKVSNKELPKLAVQIETLLKNAIDATVDSVQ